MNRRRLLAAATAVAMVAALVIAALSSTSSAGAPSPAASKDLSGSIVVIGTGGLSWSDVSARTTPALWSLLRDGATATLTIHSVHANTCPVDGWLSLSAGERAGDVDGSRGGAGQDHSNGAKPPCQALPDRMTAGMVPHWSDYLAAAAATRFGASLGLLGDQVASHGGCIQAVGPGAALGAARSDGIVDRYQPYDEATLTTALASCPATLIDVGPIRDPADVDPRDSSRPTTSRAQQVMAVDARVAAVLKAAPSGTDVMLASLADAGVTGRLRLVAVSGPHFGAGTLGSTSTRQQGLVQLADLTPTILELLTIPRPPSLGGTPLQFVPSDGSSEQSVTQRLRALLDDDEASHTVHSLVEPFFYGWALLQLTLYLIAGVLWRRGWGTVPRRGWGTIPRHGSGTMGRNGSGTMVRNGSGTMGRNGSGTMGRNGSGTMGRNGSGTMGRNGSGTMVRNGSGTMPKRQQLLGVTRHVAVVASTVPASTFLANLLPWWRFSVPLVSVVASVAVFAAAISMLALMGPWRRSLFGPMVVVCVATMVVLAADVMTGSRLQLSSLMGLQPVVGGRFHGMGNVTFALFATATLLLCTAVGNHLVSVRQPRLAAVVVAAIGLGAVIVDASPAWGSDFGGPPALLPGLTLLILAILQIRVTWRRLLAIGGGTVVFVLSLGLLDWLRPAESRSHLGRFVQTAIDGGAWDIIARKLDQNVSLLLGNQLSLFIPVGLVLITYILARPTSGAARPLQRSLRRVPLLRPGLIAVVVMWLIGFALNDSGTAIPAVGATLALPMVIALALRTLEDEPLAGPGATRASRLRR